MANRQDNKYVTKAKAQTLSSASPNMGQIENRPLKNTLQVLHMLSSTLSPFPPFRFAHHPFRNCKLKTNGKSRSNGRKTNNRSESESEWHASEQAAEYTDLQWRQFYKVSDNFRADHQLGIVLLHVLTSIQRLHLRWMCCWFPYPDLAQRHNDNDLVIAHTCSQNISKDHKAKFQPHFSNQHWHIKVLTKEIQMTKLKMTRLTSEREKEGTKKGSSNILPSNCACISNTAVATQNIQEKKQH